MATKMAQIPTSKTSGNGMEFDFTSLDFKPLLYYFEMDPLKQ